MPIISEYLKTRSKVTQLKNIGKSSVALCTELHGVKLFSAYSGEVELNIAHKYLNSATSAIAFSPDAQLLALSLNNHIHIIHMPTHKLIKTINSEEIVLLSFDLSSTYLIVGTKDARVLQYKYNNSTLLSRLYSFKKIGNRDNFVASFDFYQNYLACGSKDGTIYILNLYNRTNITLVTHNKGAIHALCFLDENTLISAHADGNIYINELINERLSKEIHTPFNTISQIILIPNTHYLIVSGETNTLALLDIKRCKIVDTKYMEFEDIVNKIALIRDEILVVALKNNKILKVELPSAQRLSSLIMHNSLEEAFALAQKNPMIQESREYKKLEKHYETSYMDAIQALINQNKNLAIQITSMFKNIPSKKDEINLLFRSFENYHRFKGLYFEKKYALAYAISSKFPALEHTHEHRQMEQIWKEAFINAQRQLILGRYDNAKALLNEYITVISKRPLIKLILSNNNSFIEFLKAIENKDFTKVATLVNENELFHQIPTYKTLENSIELKLLKIKSSIHKGDIHAAKEYLQGINNTINKEKQLEQLHLQCSHVLQLKEAYEEDDFKFCYEILDSHPFLYSTELGIFLEKYWAKTMHKCEDYALRGDIKNIKITLGELIDISSRKEKIGDLLRVSFHVKIKMLIAKKSLKNAENIIYSYIDIFGQDNEIHRIMKDFETKYSLKLAITHNHTQRVSRDNWIHSKIIMS